jgi:hypothetical protein
VGNSFLPVEWWAIRIPRRPPPRHLIIIPSYHQPRDDLLCTDPSTITKLQESKRTMPLSSVKESPRDADDASRTSFHSDSDSVSVGNNSLSAQSAASTGLGKGLKRSPYLSQMTAGVDSDLMAMLSRPSGGQAGVAAGMVQHSRGGLDFFQLKRPGGTGQSLQQRGLRSSVGGTGMRGGVSMGHLGEFSCLMH